VPIKDFAGFASAATPLRESAKIQVRPLWRGKRYAGGGLLDVEEVLVVREAAFEHQELGPSRRVKPDRLIWCPALKPNVLAAIARAGRPGAGVDGIPCGVKPNLRAVLRIELPRA
jgi:hypothetical protein